MRYPYVLLRPFWFDDAPAGMATVLLQSASGGLYAGESLGQRVALEPGAAVHLTTQAACVVHARAGGRPARQRASLEVGAGSHLEYLPEPLVLFPDAALEQDVTVDLAADGTLIYADGWLQHALPADDRPFASLHSTFQLLGPDGPLVIERCAVAGSECAGVLGPGRAPWRAVGLVVAAAPARADLHGAIANAIDAALDLPGLYAAAVPAPHGAGVVARLVARDGAALRAGLEAAWRAAHAALTGRTAPRRRK